MIAVTMGGRAAEMIVFGKLNTGAFDDIRKATGWARKMVCEWGMSEKLGPLAFGQREEQIFLGREIAQHRDFSEKTAQAIDDEVRAIVEGQYQRAFDILTEHKDMLVTVSEQLVEREILDGEELSRLMKGEVLDAVSEKNFTPMDKDDPRDAEAKNSEEKAKKSMPPFRRPKEDPPPSPATA
jgi:cell division protease FtsH